MIFAAACKFNLPLFGEFLQPIDNIVMPVVAQHVGKHTVYVYSSLNGRVLPEYFY